MPAPNCDTALDSTGVEAFPYDHSIVEVAPGQQVRPCCRIEGANGECVSHIDIDGMLSAPSRWLCHAPTLELIMRASTKCRERRARRPMPPRSLALSAKRLSTIPSTFRPTPPSRTSMILVRPTLCHNSLVQPSIHSINVRVESASSLVGLALLGVVSDSCARALMSLACSSVYRPCHFIPVCAGEQGPNSLNHICPCGEP